MRRATVVLILLIALCSCAGPRYQLPTTEADLQADVVRAEAAYKALYASQLTPPAMANVDTLYQLWRDTNRVLVDAVRAGAIDLKGE